VNIYAFIYWHTEMKREHRLDSQAEQGLFASCLRDIDSAESVSMRLTTKSFPGSKVIQAFSIVSGFT